MTLHDQLVARERAYGLLGELLRYGLRPGREQAVRGIEALGETLPDPLDLDELAAAHHRLFAMELPPYESFFLSPDRLLGGPVGEAVSRAYTAGGFRPDIADTAPDHLGVELAFLGWLEGARADAVRDGQTMEAERIAGLETHFLDEHALRWLPVLVAAVPDLDGFYGRCLDLAWALVRDHRTTLTGTASPWSLPPLPDLDDPKTGLRELAEALCTPCHAGGLLTRSAISGLGRTRRLPRGFGDRPQTLANLFRSAARFEVLDEVLGELDTHLVGWTRALGDRPSALPWLARISDSRALIARMQEGAQDVDR